MDKHQPQPAIRPKCEVGQNRKSRTLRILQMHRPSAIEAMTGLTSGCLIKRDTLALRADRQCFCPPSASH
jgi:hypothetical protein